MKILKYVLFSIILLLTGHLNAVAEVDSVWTIDNLPMVHLQDARRYLVNPDGLVSQAVQDSCDKYMLAMEKKKGIQTVFVVVNHLKGSDDLANVSSRLGDKYGVGDKKTSRGLVIIIAVKDRRWFIAPGSGLQGEYPDIKVKNIGEACIVSNMRKGDIDAAVFSTCKAFYSGQLVEYSDENDGIMSVGDFLVGIIICIFIYLMFRRGGRGGGGIFFFGGPPFFGGGFHGGFHGNSSEGGSFGGGSFNGGGSGGSW